MTTAAPLNASHPTTLPSYDDNTSTTTSATLHHDNSNIPRGPVDVALNFYEPPKDGSTPFNYVEEPPAGQPQRNFSSEAHVVTVQDARGSESNFTLDRHAFATLQHQPHNPAIDWDSDDSIKQHYYPEVEQLLLKHAPGAQRVLLFDHTIRRARPNSHRAPVTRVHIDQTPKSAAQRVRFHLPDEADTLLQGRYRIINVWRPINGPVESSPLAFADASSVTDAEVVGVEHRYPDRTGETAAVAHRDGQQWYYWSGIDEDERILLQCFDSAAPGVRVPHTAFEDPRNRDGAKERESIEMRALVFG